MYHHYFGFRERPFKLVPDLDYLFLSQSHEEALAHLRYAVADGEGFVEIIGEIGTGKTLLCRMFLESLDAGVESAYVFNPRLDALDLLKTIWDEFGIPKPAPHSVKALIDGLNGFLMEKKAAGIKVLLVIDEAQNLSLEVLEQIRLLSNLETTKEKLLRIFLVGQPELSAMLDRWELRQLRQRISLRCRLNPLSAAETRGYIIHRLQVASPGGQPKPRIFSNSALRRIYRFSEGIPRLINMACDRCLLAAYARNRPMVTGRLAAAAIRELAGLEPDRRSFPGKFRAWRPALSAGFFVASLALVLTAVYLYGGRGLSGNDPDAADASRTSMLREAPTRESIDTASPVLAVSAPSTVNDPETQRFVLPDGTAFSRADAFENLLKQWKLDDPAAPEPTDDLEDAAYFAMAAHASGLSVTSVNEDLERILRLNVPAILICRDPSVEPSVEPSVAPPCYLTLTSATPTHLLFSGPPGTPEIAMPYDQLMEFWTGRAFVVWKNFYHYRGVIPTSSPGEAVITLKLHLRDMGYPHLGISGRYDLATRMVVQAIQARHGIPVDGYVGPLTQIVLYNDTPSLSIPHLWPDLPLPAIVSEKRALQAESGSSSDAVYNSMGARP